MDGKVGMKGLIISTKENIPFAKKLLAGTLDNLKYSSALPEQETNSTESIEEKIRRCILSVEVVIAIIDEDFLKKPACNIELGIAISESKKNGTPTIIPVILDDTEVPDILHEKLFIRCDTSSKADFSDVQNLIKTVHRNYAITKKKQPRKSIYNKLSTIVILTIAIEVMAIIMAILLSKGTNTAIGVPKEIDQILMLATVATVTLSVITMAASYTTVLSKKNKEEHNNYIEEYSSRLKQAIISSDIDKVDIANRTSTKEKEIDALGRMMINLEDIKEFYTWSQKQAKASFILAVVLCSLGFLLIVAAVVLPIIFKLSLEITLIPAIGGVITEIIAGTALVVYRHSLSQLNHYHKALHEDERFLSSVNLLNKFSTKDAQDEMLKEIIKSEIQMNLKEANEEKNTSTVSAKSK